MSYPDGLVVEVLVKSTGLPTQTVVEEAVKLALGWGKTSTQVVSQADWPFLVMVQM